MKLKQTRKKTRLPKGLNKLSRRPFKKVLKAVKIASSNLSNLAEFLRRSCKLKKGPESLASLALIRKKLQEKRAKT